MNLEIEAQRRAEARLNDWSVEADRLCRRLVDVYRCDFVVAEGVGFKRWGKLPRDYKSGIEGPIECGEGMPPRDYRGPVAVTLETLRWISMSHCACGALLVAGKCIRCEEDRD